MEMIVDAAAAAAAAAEFEDARVPALPQMVKVRAAAGGGLGERSDIVSGSYEGGLKVWECARDLACFVAGAVAGWALRPHRTRVLDVGCGHGLAGIAALLASSSPEAEEAAPKVAVDFCDFNEEVLASATAPNVARNCGAERARACRYFAGDWRALAALERFPRRQYDVAVSSDTVYSAESIPALVQLLHCALARPHGTAYVAGRRFYFGVGGGTLDLVEEVSRSCPDMECRRVQHFTAGVERETIAISFKA